MRHAPKRALARVLAQLEQRPWAEASLALLDQAWARQTGLALGITGPPGVGKSTLLSRLLAEWRRGGRRVAVLAVDPSSRRSGGSLLGDRARLEHDPGDAGLFIRSLAAGRHLGGTAAPCAPMLVLLRSLFDLVVVETVGVGQSETEITELVDLVLLAVQPASGDTLQFLKAGIAEIPDLAVVTKGDLGPLAQKTARDLAAALPVSAAAPGAGSPVLSVSAANGEGIAELVAAIDRLWSAGPDEARRARQGRYWIEAGVREELGCYGIARLGAIPAVIDRPPVSPFRELARVLPLLVPRP